MKSIHTIKAPAAIGTYSQAIVHDKVAYLSGQIPLDPENMQLIAGDIAAQIRQVLDNLARVAQAAGSELNNAIKINVFLVDLNNFQYVNEVMAEYFHEPYPARAAIGVAALPKGAEVEMDAIIALPA